MHPTSRSTSGARLFAVGVLLAAIAGCARIRTVETSDAAFIYGFFDVPESVGDAECVGIIQDEKVGIAGRHGCMRASPEGLFYVENVPPLRYNIHGFNIGRTFNSLGDMAKPFTVKPGALHYYGTFRYQKVSDAGIGRAGKFTLRPASHPTHAEVLKKLLAQKDLDPRWRKRIAARLREVSG